MKTKKVILFSVSNLVAFLIIWAIAGHVSQKNKFGSKFRPNSFIMSDTVDCNAPANYVYHFYIHHYDEIYHKTAEKHREFTLLNNDSIAPGTEIFCREGEESEIINHHYVVNEVITKKLIYKSSEPSTINMKTDKGIVKNECNSYVYVEFFDVSENSSRVAFTIIVQMPNYMYKLAGRLLGGKKVKEEWEGHLREELDGFVENYNLYMNQ